MSRRVQRVADAIKQVVADLLVKEVKDPRVGMVTLTEVAVSPDLRHARIFVSVFGDEERRKEAMAGLRSASGFIRTEIAHRVRLRVTPELVFEFDATMDQADRVSQLLKDVLPEEPDS